VNPELPEIDFASLDDGIRETVRFLRQHGFDTCDSGDGSKASWMEGALDFPHVVIATRRRDMAGTADRLLRILRAHGVDVEHGHICASYDPVDESCILSLYHVVMVKDAMPGMRR
jgi:hypothetical protein